MKQTKKQKKPYNRVRCKLIDFTSEAILFTASGTDMEGLSPIGVATYESIQRMYEYGQTHPYTGTSTDEYERYKNYIYDPFYDYWVGKHDGGVDPNYCWLVPPNYRILGYNKAGYNVATRFGGITMGEFRQVFPSTIHCARWGEHYHPIMSPCSYCC